MSCNITDCRKPATAPSGLCADHYFIFYPPGPPPTPEVDMVEAPPHYKAGGLEAIDVVEAFDLGFRLGNAVKYILRADRKGARLEDLRKARWYIDREIAKGGS